MLSSEQLLTPERRRSYRRKRSMLVCSSWTAGWRAVTQLIYLSKLWNSPVRVFFLLQLTLLVYSSIILSFFFYKESDLLSEDP